MKNKLFLSIPMVALLLSCSDGTSSTETTDPDPVRPPLKEVRIGDFETEATTPYFFRFGNRGSAKEYTYKPRWVYSHEVVDNPVAGSLNSSAKVLKYTSMEARNYGLKIRFTTPVAVDDLGEVQLKIYQPASVVGKPLWQGGTPARTQELCVKLLSAFNSINDFRQDEGILLLKQSTPFTEEGKWIIYNCSFNKADYASQLNKFSKGIVGIAVLPTYKSEVTLLEASPYVCYLDDIVLNPVTN